MNVRNHSMRNGPASSRRKARGVGLIEVMIAMLILAVGFLALAQLQTAATRSAAEARARTASVNLASDKLEELRAFLGRATDSNGDGDPDLIVDLNGDGIADDDGLAFDGIVSGTDSPDEVGTGTRGYDFTRSWTSTPCTIERNGTLACGGTVTAATADFLRVAVEVEWASAEGTSTNPNQRVIVEDLISSSTPLDAAVAMSQPVTNRERPKVYIQPSRIQSTIPIAIGDGLDSAASDPQPTIIRDNIVRTQFEVLTFSRDDNGLLAERIFDYTVVGCDCELNAATSGVKSYEPTVWNGLTFTRPREVTNGEPHPSSAVTGTVSRVTGTAVLRNSDPPIIKDLCTACCRDHHDTLVTSTPKLDPTRPSSEYLSNGNHRHYLPVLSGNSYTFREATAPGDPYYETCRFLRRDGIYRLTLDAHLVDLAAFRLRDLDTTDETDLYADYARQFIDSYVDRAAAEGSTYPNFDAATMAAIYADGKDGLDSSITGKLDPTTHYALPTPGVQLLSRGIYVDYMTPEVLAAIRCKINNTPDAPACLPYREVEKLELVPFFAVGMTRLNNWRPENSQVLTLDITDRGDPFSRGFAVPQRDGASNAIASSPISNIGLTNPIPANALEAGATITDTVPLAVGGLAPPDDPPRNVTFEISRDRNTLLDDSNLVLLSGSAGLCRQTGQQAGRTTWVCALTNAGTGSVVFSNYTGSECTARDGGRCITFAPVRNRLCFTPQPPAVTRTTPSNAYGDTTTATFDGTQPASATYSVDVMLGSATCPGSDAFPGVTATTPANGATGVLPTASVAVTFSEAVNVAANGVTLSCNGQPDLIRGGLPATNVTTLTLAHDDMPWASNCTLTVNGTAVTDVDTVDPPDAMGTNYVVTFQTASFVPVDDPPRVIGTVPGNGTAGILPNQALSITFSEAVDVRSGAVTLTCGGGANLITGGLSVGNVTTVTPTYAGTLPAGATCTLTVIASLVYDVDLADPPDNMLANYVATFTVAAIDSPPYVSSTLPANGATNVGNRPTITLNFNEAVNVATNAVTVTCPNAPTTNIANANVALTNVTTMSVTVNTNLQNSAFCTLTLNAASVVDRDGTPTPMAANFVMTFRRN